MSPLNHSFNSNYHNHSQSNQGHLDKHSFYIYFEITMIKSEYGCLNAGRDDWIFGYSTTALLKIADKT